MSKANIRSALEERILVRDGRKRVYCQAPGCRRWFAVAPRVLASSSDTMTVALPDGWTFGPYHALVTCSYECYQNLMEAP